jgi:YD repeat-containing protein
MRTQRRSGNLILAAFVAVLLAAGPGAAQQATVHWVHDEVGRIRAVVDAQGDVGVYQYDAVGNLVGIERVTVSGLPGAVAISLVTPGQGKVGSSVTLFGKGFSSTPAQNAVAFNGTAATVTAAAPTRLVVTVPAGATTGSITLTAPLGNATSPSAFTVVAVTGLPAAPWGKILRITAPSGWRWIDLTYDSQSRIIAATDQGGRVVRYTYDGSGRLATVTDAGGGVTEYTYDGSHRLLTIKDARGIVFLTNAYDGNGRVTQQTQADSTTYQLAYTVDGGGKVTQTDLTNPRGYVRRATFDAAGYPLTDTQAQGQGIAQTTIHPAGGDELRADGHGPAGPGDSLHLRRPRQRR